MYVLLESLKHNTQGNDMFKFNIGSAVLWVDQSISTSEVLAALHYIGFVDAEVIKTQMSGTETTYIVTAAGFNDWFGAGHKAAVHSVCLVLGQDAIAYKLNDTGHLVGPKAADWGGEFLQSEFIE